MSQHKSQPLLFEFFVRIVVCENGRKKNHKRKIFWSLEDEEYLVELWGDKIGDLRGSRKNLHIYKEMSAAFEGRSSVYSPGEIQVKIHNLTTKYKKEKKIIGPSGGSPSEWNLYQKIHTILGEHKLHNLDLIVVDSRPIANLSGSSASSSISCVAESENSPSPSSPFAVSPDDAPSTSRPRARKRTISSGDEIRAVDERMDFLISSMIESDAKSLELDKKRNEILQDFVSESKKFHKGLLQFLNK